MTSRGETRARVTGHFNALSEPQQERLAILAEECSEAVKAACKILRHGYESMNPLVMPECQESNREALQRELGEVMHIVARMVKCGDLDLEKIDVAQRAKPGRMEPYLHHQQGTWPPTR